MKKYIFKVLSVCAFVLLNAHVHAQSVTVTDIVGRKVTLKSPAKRVILGEGRSLLTLSLLDPNPVGMVVGWTGDFAKSGGNIYDEYMKRFPAMAKIPQIGGNGKETVSTEKIISLKPDLAIFGSGSHGPDAKSADVIRQLEAAGIPIVFVDFRLHPFKNTLPSMALLGKVLGKEKKANEYIAFYKTRMDRISKALAGKKASRPKVYMEMIRGQQIGSPGKGNLGEFIEFAGGHNIGADILPGEVGTLNMEFVIRQQPDIYIASGIASVGEPGLVIGYGISAAETQKSLKALADRSVVSPLSAVKNKKVYGMWHLFYDSPLNIAAVEAIAKWLNPTLFKTVNPDETLRQINEKFLAVPFKGTYFAELK
ncbi:ABC transporter substrate-binding protein [Dyadobacter sp. CY312]|uniref:ABC transporter substrate-binding protein n=1 Tax=Dyadobacter sp. CY312 TaxID=2907303 RepID=UPI001F3F2C20|nr:ABC transporter substrate-binding protein [Dyadobacter sp. CY312]MCE7040322.1 ABC transporter substrate-binding protein [Dyadobacter sp. CY312]